MGARTASVAFALVALLGCGKHHESATHPSASASAPAYDPIRPPTRNEFSTTNGEIAMGNLDSQIHAATKGYEAAPKEPSNIKVLVDLLSTRAQYTNRVSDLERSDELADELVKAAPHAASSFATRASTRSGLHRFKDALADLDEATKLGATPESLAGTRASILQATGDLDGALVIRQAAAKKHPDISTLVPLAALEGEIGHVDEAEKDFEQALAEYRGVSALAVSWLLFQEATMWEREGKTERAHAFYAAAYERLPGYCHAASHLAALEPPARAIEILKPIVENAEDPEFEWVLAQSYRKAGDSAAADEHMKHVAGRYDELVAKHPQAYRDHAAAFFLTDGGDPKKALELSKASLEDRKISSIYETGLLAAIKSGSHDDACSLADGVHALQHPTEMLKSIAADACKP